MPSLLPITISPRRSRKSPGVPCPLSIPGPGHSHGAGGDAVSAQVAGSRAVLTREKVGLGKCLAPDETSINSHNEKKFYYWTAAPCWISPCSYTRVKYRSVRMRKNGLIIMIRIQPTNGIIDRHARIIQKAA